jgi:hypothetical protein
MNDDELNDNIKNSKLLKAFFKDPNKMSATDIKYMRETYKKFLDEKAKEKPEIEIEELAHLYNQFCNFASLHTLVLLIDYIHENDKDKDIFLNKLIVNFISQIKTNLYRGFELSELKQEDSILFKIMGKEIITKEYDITNFIGAGENLLVVRVADDQGAGGVWKPVIIYGYQ